jgi:hypothetical protein
MRRRQFEVLDLRMEHPKSERERRKLTAVRAKLEQHSHQDPAMPGSLNQISKRLRDRAGERRVIAEICGSVNSQRSFNRMAWNYDQLAQRAARPFNIRRP